MSQYYALPDAENGFSAAVTSFCKKLLESGAVQAVMAPQRLPNSPMVHHTLVQDASKLNNADPSAPVMNINGGTLAARLTRQDPGGKIGVLLRPCELRAYAELVKLNQGDRDYALLIGTDCYGTFEPPDFHTWAGNASNGNGAFLEAVRSSGEAPKDAPEIRKSCRACEYPTPDIADIQIQLMGVDGAGAVTSGTEAGAAVLSTLGLSEKGEPSNRQKAVGDIVAKRTAFRDTLFEEVRTELLPMEKILNELSRCINCYNCRDACPVCYCRSCVFDGQTFEHPSSQYLKWAQRKGAIKMPTDTLFFHTTRMSHMSTSCVGCGQCTSACPMGIRVGDIFRTVAQKTQAVFDYVPGRSFDETLPMTMFREEELEPK